MALITSPHNERIKLVRALQSSGKSRRKENRVALEGVRLIGDAISSGVTPDFVLYTQDAIAEGQPGSRLFADLQARNVSCLEVVPEVMSHAADTETPQGMIAVTPLPQLPLPSTITLALICDGIADPGNLGTMLRTAGAAGVDVVMLMPGCVDAFNPKVLRAGMGAHFRVPIIRPSWEALSEQFSGLRVYLADAQGQTTYTSVDWTQPCAVIIGGEAHGAEAVAHKQASATVSIPMAKGAESLNAASAAAVILFEVRRQRA